MPKRIMPITKEKHDSKVLHPPESKKPENKQRKAKKTFAELTLEEQAIILSIHEERERQRRRREQADAMDMENPMWEDSKRSWRSATVITGRTSCKKPM